jgi:hypothetical protein
MRALIKWPCDIQHYSSQHMEMESNRMNVCYACLPNSDGFQEEDHVWLYCPTQPKPEESSLQCNRPGNAITT